MANTNFSQNFYLLLQCRELEEAPLRVIKLLEKVCHGSLLSPFLLAAIVCVASFSGNLRKMYAIEYTCKGEIITRIT